MPKRTTTEIIRTNLPEHPAVKAWRELRPTRIVPDSVEILHERKKSAVYRLEGVGPGGTPVIAKRCQTPTALIERTIYEEVLPHLPIPALHYYGFIEEDDKFCWLFLEDVGREQFSPLIEEHRALAARWLGLMHTSAAHVAAAACLPDGGPGRYMEHLRSARHTILRNLTNPGLSADDVAVLETIVSHCDVLESRWSQVEQCCEAMPPTLVHGDFTGKNLRVRTGQAGIALLPFDWECAGWGIPVTDLAQSARRSRGGFSANPDVVTYWSVVRDHCPSLDLQVMQGLANCGKTFRCLAAINWAAQSLAYEWVESVMCDMRIYQIELLDAIQAAGWGIEHD